MFLKTNLIRLLAIGLLTVFTATACSPVNYAIKAPIDRNVSERAPKSLKIEVQEFTWSYVGGDRIQAKATVKNNTGRPQTSLTIFAMLFDENGQGVAMGESFISPPYLAAGAVGSIEINARTSRPSGIKHIRLLTNAVRE